MTGFNLKNFKQPPSEAKWFKFDEGFELFIAPMTSPDYLSWIKSKSPDLVQIQDDDRQAPVPDGQRSFKKSKKRRKQSDIKIDTEALDPVVREGIARFILLGWRGITEEQKVVLPPDKPKEVLIPYSTEKSVEFLTAKDENGAYTYEPFYELILGIASNPAEFVDPTPTEDEAGNYLTS